jgi:release factor glutamine methyltransferase
MTIAEAIAEGARRLHNASVPEERRTAGVLLCHLLGVDRTHLLTRSDEEIEPSRYEQYIEFVERRASGEPVQYITGHQEFYGRDFAVTPDALIPRPETEFIIERVIALSALRPVASVPLIVDIGTGSGCIAVTLAAEFPAARVIATDISSAALNVARANAERHSVSSRIEFLEGDLFEPLAGRGLEGAIDFIATNPPYVPSEDQYVLQREVREWEPQVALFGGPKGLDIYRLLLADAQNYLKPDGFLVCEIGYTQLDRVTEMINETGLEVVEVTSDLQGFPRTLTIRKL